MEYDTCENKKRQMQEENLLSIKENIEKAALDEKEKKYWEMRYEFSDIGSYCPPIPKVKI